MIAIFTTPEEMSCKGVADALNVRFAGFLNVLAGRLGIPYAELVTTSADILAAADIPQERLVDNADVAGADDTDQKSFDI